jgi:hypothetical protein
VGVEAVEHEGPLPPDQQVVAVVVRRRVEHRGRVGRRVAQHSPARVQQWLPLPQRHTRLHKPKAQSSRECQGSIKGTSWEHQGNVKGT